MTATGQPQAGRISATPAAREAVKRLCAARGGPVMFVQSAGCCAGSVPMCFPAGEFITGAHDLLLGDVEGCPFYIGAALDAAWHTPDLILDVADGEPEGFSLGPGSGLRFITRAAGSESHRHGHQGLSEASVLSLIPERSKERPDQVPGGGRGPGAPATRE